MPRSTRRPPDVRVRRSADVRYVHRSRRRVCRRADVQIAILAHELRHAVEIADAPGVIDRASLAREYKRIGYPERSPRCEDAIASTRSAAVEAGYPVLRDLIVPDV